MITVQYELTIARRGTLTTTVKERTFNSEEALQRWAERNSGNVTILRYEFPPETQTSPDAEPFCDACQQHKPCSCDDMANDRRIGYGDMLIDVE